MAEFFSALKSLIVCALIVLLLQTRWGGSTLEGQATAWLKTGTIPVYLTHVADGATKLIQVGLKKVQMTIGGFVSQSKSNESRASKFNFDFKRSEAVTKNSSESEESY